MHIGIRALKALGLVVFCALSSASGSNDVHVYDPSLNKFGTEFGALPLSALADLQRVLNDVPDTVPPNVRCEKIKKCDRHNVCAIVCAHGTVQMPRWVQHALSSQRKLAYQSSFCHAQLPGSHNSGITLADGYGIEDPVWTGVLKYISWITNKHFVHTNDQLFSLTDQLNFGVRLLELDVHWFNNDLHIAHCGGFHTSVLDNLIFALNYVAKLLGMKIQWDSNTIGCKPSLSSIPADDQRTLAAALEEISLWSKKPENKEEFVLVFFDDESDLSKWHKVARLRDLVENYFDLPEVVMPEEIKAKNISLERRSMQSFLDEGKRFFFMSGSNYDDPKNTYPWFSKRNICSWTEPRLPIAPFPNCTFIQNESWVPNSKTIFRPQTSEIQYGPLNADGHFGINQDLLDEKSLLPSLECGVNIPSPDNLTPKRMEAMVWAFSEGYFSLNGTLCSYMSMDSPRWKSVPCTAEQVMPMVCQISPDGVFSNDTDIEWSFTTPVKTGDISSACKHTGDPLPPLNAYLNRRLHSLLNLYDIDRVWIPFRVSIP